MNPNSALKKFSPPSSFERGNLFFEACEDHTLRRRSYRASGALRTAGRKTRAAIYDLMNPEFMDPNYQYDADSACIARNLNQAHKHGIDLEQALTDKVSPIFWAPISGHSARMAPYERGYARESVENFKQQFGFSRSDWAWACKKNPRYLFDFFKSINLGSGCIRWPENLVGMYSPDNPYYPPRPLEQWLKKLFLSAPDRPFIDLREFNYIMRDVNDLLNARPDIIDILVRQKDWESFVRKVRELERGASSAAAGGVTAIEAQRQLEWQGITWSTGFTRIQNRFLNGILFDDEVWAASTSVPPVPPDPEPYEWLAGLHKYIGSSTGMTAHLIDNKLRLYEEGRDMKHCIWRSYRDRIEAKEYLAYHIEAPELDKNGFTLGICKSYNDAPRYWTNVHEGIPPNGVVMDRKFIGWKIDQVRGLSNSIPQDKELHDFAETISQKVNESLKI